MATTDWQHALRFTPNRAGTITRLGLSHDEGGRVEPPVTVAPGVEYLAYRDASGAGHVEKWPPQGQWVENTVRPAAIHPVLP